ncbi:MAG: DUF1896 domain-containing protein [Bacteroidales bacterium]|jgi:hypothetical protein|nr:DUF1896 domain-containing protein [Bacteroidales bacterium]
MRDLSYYKLSLTDFLQKSHPNLIDEAFINARAALAVETYEDAIKNGYNHIEAGEQASQVLFDGLHFSKFDTLVNILQNEFSGIVPEEKIKELVMKLLPECEEVFSKYPLFDDFDYESAFNNLYTELTGTVAIYLDHHAI